MSSTARLVFCEQDGRWATRISGELGRYGREVCSLQECQGQLDEAPSSFFVVELTVGPIKSMIEFLTQARRRQPRARIVVVGKRSDLQWEWLLRDAGATAVVCDLHAAGELVRLARRHFANLPPTEATLRQQIWDRLPWADVATEH